MKIIKPNIEILTPIDYKHICKFIEECGRTCYKSTPTNDSAETFLRGIIKSGHISMLEHYQITVRMICDIGVYKDLTRHRHASFSIESTRWCNYSKGKFGNELTFVEPIHITDAGMYSIWYGTMNFIEKNYIHLASLGAKPDQLRMLLPHSTASEVVMTANIREWRYILKLRTAKDVHPAVRELMCKLLAELKEKLPVFFEDINIEN